jgi:hypothetical protein
MRREVSSGVVIAVLGVIAVVIAVIAYFVFRGKPIPETDERPVPPPPPPMSAPAG